MQEKKEVKKWQDEEALRRYQMIAPLLDADLDEGKKRQIREKAAEKNGISKRSLYRYEEKYRSSGFEGLRPMGRTKKRVQRLPDNFGEVMEQAVQLKREVPKRSVRQIIKILELEGWAAPGVLKRSTMQRHLYNAGLGKKQMKRYAEKRESSSRRFCRPHRMELLQGDIKYGPDISVAAHLFWLQINLIDCHRINRYNDISIEKEKVPEHLFFCRDKCSGTIYKHGYYIKIRNRIQ